MMLWKFQCTAHTHRPNVNITDDDIKQKGKKSNRTDAWQQMVVPSSHIK